MFCCKAIAVSEYVTERDRWECLALVGLITCHRSTTINGGSPSSLVGTALKDLDKLKEFVGAGS